MMEKKKAADERQHVKPQEHGVASNNTDAIVTDSKPEVKSENAIQRLRVERHIPVADMVEVVRTLYPGYDKPLHSKVDNGDKYGIRLRADAEKQAAILRAEGQAQAILAVQKATAEAMRLLNEACPNDQVIKLKALEAMQKIADGKATKIIIPSEIQGLAGLASGLVEAVKEPKNNE